MYFHYIWIFAFTASSSDNFKVEYIENRKINLCETVNIRNISTLSKGKYVANSIVLAPYL